MFATLVRFVLAVTLCTAGSMSVRARPGGSGGSGGSTIPPGSIYYGAGQYSYSYPIEYKMKSDGSGSTKLFSWSAANTNNVNSPSATLSYNAHGGGDRWYVGKVNGDCTTGALPRIALTSPAGVTAMYDVNWGAVDTRASNPSVPCAGDPGDLIWDFEWVPGDAQISFIGREVDANYNVLRAGVYTLNVTYNGVGEPTISLSDSPQYSMPTVTVMDSVDGLESAFHSLSWKPDGSAYAATYNQQIYTVNSVNGPTLVYTNSSSNGIVRGPSWGASNRLAFSLSNGAYSAWLYTIGAAGGAATLMDSAKGGSAYPVFENLSWSPDGTYLAYDLGLWHGVSSTQPDTSVIKRVNATGGSIVTLLNQKNYLRVRGWR